MRHVFILNPMAGKNQSALAEQILMIVVSLLLNKGYIKYRRMEISSIYLGALIRKILIDQIGKPRKYLYR